MIDQGFSDEQVSPSSGLGEYVPCFRKEIRIVEYDLDCPVDLLGDALSRSVSAGEKLKIRQVVVGRRFQPVMDGFFFGQFSAKVLLHHVAMFKNVFASNAVYGWESKQNIASHFSANHRSFSAWTFAFVFRDQVSLLQRATTRIAASSGPGEADASSGERLFAEFAGSSRNVGSTDVRACAGAVLGVLAPLFSVRSEMPRRKLERVSAVPACESNSGDDGFGSAFFRQVREIAVSAAKLVRFSGSNYRERFLAANAGSYQGHLSLVIGFCLYANTSSNASCFMGAC